MNYDFYAEFWDREKDVKFNELENKISEPLVRAKLLKLSKNEVWAKKKHNEGIKKLSLKEVLKLIQKLYILPEFDRSIFKAAIFIKIEFKLKKPYISQDDENFYIIDNPICKDKVFKVPLVRASSWKGALRYSATRIVLGKEGEEKINVRLALVRLFGNEKDKIEEFMDEQFGDKLNSKYKQKLKTIYGEEPNLRGRLVFYPTFFEKIGLDVIAPHDRETKTPARGPIYFETVPEKTGNENTKGDFYLLYYPFDLLGKDGKEVKEEITQDMKILKEAIPAMLTKYGFGAKTTAGYGVADIEKIEVNGKDCGNGRNKVLEVVKHEYEK